MVTPSIAFISVGDQRMRATPIRIRGTPAAM